MNSMVYIYCRERTHYTRLSQLAHTRIGGIQRGPVWVKFINIHCE